MLNWLPPASLPVTRKVRVVYLQDFFIARRLQLLRDYLLSHSDTSRSSELKQCWNEQLRHSLLNSLEMVSDVWSRGRWGRSWGGSMWPWDPGQLSSSHVDLITRTWQRTPENHAFLANLLLFNPNLLSLEYTHLFFHNPGSQGAAGVLVLRHQTLVFCSQPLNIFTHDDLMMLQHYSTNCCAAVALLW